jgi:recombination protein RecA
MGSSPRKVSSPRKNGAAADPVKVSTSQLWATFCIQVPIVETKAPIHSTRKSRYSKAAAIRRRPVGGEPGGKASAVVTKKSEFYLLDHSAGLRYIFASGEDMANQALAAVESALRHRKLDRTLTTALPSGERLDASTCLATGVERLDACLRGGFPRGQLCEVTGPRSSGRTALLMQLIGAATARGEIAALVDTCDRLDVESAVAAGIDLDRLLWIRGAPAHPGGLGLPRHAQLDRVVERALKALNLVLQAGGFGLVAIDVADIPITVLKRLPFTTWMRVQRTLEGSETTCVIVAPEPLARSAGGLTLSLSGRAGWSGAADRSRRLDRLDITTRMISPRRRVGGEVAINAQCPMPNAQCSMPMLNAQCSMPNAQCSMPNAQCPMLNAQCPMLNAQCPM